MNLLNNSTFWVALSSIATFSMVLLTYLLLRHYKKADEERMLRETIEKLIQPLNRNLAKIIEIFRKISPSDLHLSISMEEVWQWTKIKHENSFLAFRLSKSISEKIEDFHETLGKHIYLYNQNILELNNIIFNEIKEKTGKDTLTSGTKGAYYELSIGGKRYQITFHDLLFQDQSLDEYIERLKNDPKIPNNEIKDMNFVINGHIIDGLDKENFQEIASTILGKTKCVHNLQALVESCRGICKEAQTLRHDLFQILSKIGENEGQENEGQT